MLRCFNSKLAWWMLSSLIYFGGLNSVFSSNITVLNNVIFLLNEDINANQYVACNNMGYAPTSVADTVHWGLEVFNEVAVAFGSISNSINISSTLIGCCTSSMFCYIDQYEDLLCYASGFGAKYENPFTSNKLSPSDTAIFNIYTCKPRDSEVDITVSNVLYSDSSVVYGETYVGSFNSNGLLTTLNGFNFPKNEKHAVSTIQVSAKEVNDSANESGGSSGFGASVGAGSGKNSYLCSYLEVCSNLCAICDADHDCPGNSQCVSTVAPWNTGWCFPLCAGPRDLACPCNSICYSNMFSYTSAVDNKLFSIALNLCSPNSGFNCQNGMFADVADVESASIAQCLVLGHTESNVTNSGYASLVMENVGDIHENVDASEASEITTMLSSSPTEASSSVVESHGLMRGTDMSPVTPPGIVRYSRSHFPPINSGDIELVGERSLHDHKRTLSVAQSFTECTTDSDCYDGDKCTIDRCNQTSGSCLHSVYSNCATSPKIRQTLGSYKYMPTLLLNTTASQIQFVKNMLSNGIKMLAYDASTGSSVYMRPTTENISTTSGSSIALPRTHYFQYYGTLITSLAVNPNGLISLAPVAWCTSTGSTLLCINYGTESNSISIWNEEWVYCSDSAVYYHLHDLSGGMDNTPIIEILFHSVYFVPKKVETNRNAICDDDDRNSSRNSFGVSIFSDGSIKLQYIEVQYSSISNETFSPSTDSANGVSTRMSMNATYGDTETLLVDPQKFSLWGARASSFNSYLLDNDVYQYPYLQYHEEYIPYPGYYLYDETGSSWTGTGGAEIEVSGGMNSVYCYIPYTIACAPNSCVTASTTSGEQFTLILGNNYSTSNIHLANTTYQCRALGDDFELRYDCIWSNGVSTNATISTVTSNVGILTQTNSTVKTDSVDLSSSTHDVTTNVSFVETTSEDTIITVSNTILTCDVPTMTGVSNGALITVSIGITAVAKEGFVPSGTLVPIPGFNRFASNNTVHSDIFFTKLSRDSSGGETNSISERTNSEIILQYHTAPTNCGCNALNTTVDEVLEGDTVRYSPYACDACSVCRRINTMNTTNSFVIDENSSTSTTTIITNTSVSTESSFQVLSSSTSGSHSLVVQYYAAASFSLDCGGRCYGSAYYDSCNNCTGGLTEQIPYSYCAFESSDTLDTPSANYDSVLSAIIFILLLFSFGVCCLVLNAYYRKRHNNLLMQRRRENMERWLHEELVPALNAMNDTESGHNRGAPSGGLTKQEMRCLGSFKYSDANEKCDFKSNSAAAVDAQEKLVGGDIELSIAFKNCGNCGDLGNDACDDAAACEESDDEDLKNKAATSSPGVFGEFIQKAMDSGSEVIGSRIGSRIASTSPTPNPCSIECAICLSTIQNGELCRKLPAPCNHIFHEGCVDQWFQMSSKCPLCKRSIRDIIAPSLEADNATDYEAENVGINGDRVGDYLSGVDALLAAVASSRNQNRSGANNRRSPHFGVDGGGTEFGGYVSIVDAVNRRAEDSMMEEAIRLSLASFEREQAGSGRGNASESGASGETNAVDGEGIAASENFRETRERREFRQNGYVAATVDYSDSEEEFETSDLNMLPPVRLHPSSLSPPRRGANSNTRPG